ncbi:excinuclease ABC subunit UvrB [bacterium]|nr:excinuclease ABC subunit UvrB [bacterium]QQR58935.1 MAG: excinuclease ABC subunit UvrB [Candidatus Melainabacteria bacterium]
MPPFKVHAPFTPDGDQPKAIAELTRGVVENLQFQTLLGVTGSGKTMTMAHVIQETQMPALVLAHNKTLAAQLCSEMQSFFPENAVEYFISYYDYYQPESYIPSSDTFIEKEARINDEIDRLRHSTTRSLWERPDVVVVASVSCIYGLGVPERYLSRALEVSVGDKIDQRQFMRQLVQIYYERNDLAMERARFRSRGDVLEVFPPYEKRVIRLEFFDETIERIAVTNPTTGEVEELPEKIKIYPAKHYVADEEEIERAVASIEAELEDRTAELMEQGKLLEAQRLKQRTRFDIEMLKEVGHCNGIENYSRIMENRLPGTPPQTLLDYFVRKFGQNGFLTFVDESHVSLPQIRGMFAGDRSRKDTLIDYGFRLPCARDNRPLTFEEFNQRVGKIIYVSATPGDYELEKSENIVEQIIRPTGLVDPNIDIRPIEGQIDDLIKEIKIRATAGERVLITTLTKRMAEDLTEYLQEIGIKVRWLHSEIKALERVELLQELRQGKFDVLVGVNLLREGLDLPEVSLVAIMEADKEGFLRAQRALIQTIGRAARNSAGRVIMYADKMTDSMKGAIEETDRRREIQTTYNKEHNIVPTSIVKETTNTLLYALRGEEDDSLAEEVFKVKESNLPLGNSKSGSKLDIKKIIAKLEEKMKTYAKNLDFEKAAEIRDEIRLLREHDRTKNKS